MIAHSFTVRLLSSGQLECLSAAEHFFSLGQGFQKVVVGLWMARITCLKQLRDPGLRSLDSRDAVPWFCSSVSSIEDSFSKIERPDLQTWEWKLDSDILKVRFNLLEKQREGNLDTSRRTFKSLGNRIAQDVTGVWPSDTQGPDEWNHWAERMRPSQSKERTTSRWQVGVLSDTKEKSES